MTGTARSQVLSALANYARTWPLPAAAPWRRDTRSHADTIESMRMWSLIAAGCVTDEAQQALRDALTRALAEPAFGTGHFSLTIDPLVIDPTDHGKCRSNVPAVL